IELCLSGRKFSAPENVRSEIDGLRPRKTSGRRERHRLLNLVHKIRQGSRTPVREKIVADERRPAHSFHCIAVTFGALRFVNVLPTRCLRIGVHTVRDRADLPASTPSEATAISTKGTNGIRRIIYTFLFQQS